jgi:uncharacterized membrane protein YoaK (UPF0700 family)
MSSTTSDGERNRPPPAARLSAWEIRVVALLSVIAGAVDLIGFFTLGNIFTAHITGNLVLVSAVFLRDVNPAQALAIPMFFIAVAATWLLAKRSGREGANLVRFLLSFQFLLLGVVLLTSVIANASANQRSLTAGLIAMIAVCAMASQHALLRLAIPTAPSTAVMTGNVTSAVLAFLDALSQEKFSLAGPAERRLARSMILLAGFGIGCVTAALAVHWFQDWAWSLPLALTAAAIVLK